MESNSPATEVHVDSIRTWPACTARIKEPLLILSALALGAALWSMPPPHGMSEKSMQFLATMLVAVFFWVVEIFDEYVVALMLLLFWVVLDIVPTHVALSGFSQNSWFFTIGALGIAATIGKTELLQRLSVRLLNWVPIRRQNVYLLSFLVSGALSGPLLPTGKARTAVAVPISQSVSDAANFLPRSNGSAAISLAAFIGFSQMSFMFLTGSELGLIGWNFLPPAVRGEFGWLPWFVAAVLPALCVIVLMLFSIKLLFPLTRGEKERLAALSGHPLKSPGRLTRNEWTTLTTLLLTVAGWLTTSLHGINEAWVALAAVIVLLLTGALDRKGFKQGIDWGLIMFFGVLNSMAVVAEHTKVSTWFVSLSGSLLGQLAGAPVLFLLCTCLLIFGVRFLLRKTPTAALLAVTILPLSDIAGIHPGVVVVVGIMAAECFLFGYQDGPYQIAYGANGGKAFSHGQACKVLAAKYLATLLAVAVSVPYWRFLGLIR